MRTDELIRLLAQDAAPRWRFRPLYLAAVLAGIVIVAIVFFSTIGFRADISSAMESVRFVFKFVVTISLAISAGSVALALGQPGIRSGRLFAILLLPLLLLAWAVDAELFVLPQNIWAARMIGSNYAECLTILPLFSAGPLACLLFALRQGAPEKPGLAGAIAGLAASGIGATFYAANCTDDSPLFVALWYPMAIAIVTTVGYLIGRSALKW
ncbi:MAG: NrsF family protein [Parvibaculaceae bacterium]